MDEEPQEVNGQSHKNVITVKELLEKGKLKKSQNTEVYYEATQSNSTLSKKQNWSSGSQSCDDSLSEKILSDSEIPLIKILMILVSS